MSHHPSSQHKDELLAALADSEKASAELKRRAQELTESAGYAEGLAQRLQPLIKKLPDDSALPEEHWKDLHGVWREQHKQTQASLFSIVPLNPLSSATTAAATLTTSATSEVITAWVPKGPELEALRSYLHRPMLIDRVRQLAATFDLTVAHSGSRSPVQLLDEAAAEMVRPAGQAPAPTGVLIAARSAIDSTLASLLRRRPRQEETRNAVAKVTSLGLQCGARGLGFDFFERLGRDLHSLLDRLSTAKGADLSPGEVEHRFDQALQFLDALLSSLDASKLNAI